MPRFCKLAAMSAAINGLAVVAASILAFGAGTANASPVTVACPSNSAFQCYEYSVSGTVESTPFFGGALSGTMWVNAGGTGGIASANITVGGTPWDVNGLQFGFTGFHPGQEGLNLSYLVDPNYFDPANGQTFPLYYYLELWMNLPALQAGTASPINSFNTSYGVFNVTAFCFGCELSSSSGEVTPFGAAPLPAALPLFATGLAGLGWLARRRRK